MCAKKQVLIVLTLLAGTLHAQQMTSTKRPYMASNQGDFLGYPRNYAIEVSQPERSDIRYIVTTLANKSLISIAMVKGDLESAGNRIAHLHPLRFLLSIFQDEELKVGIRNIRSKGWAWNHFFGGIKQSLTTEARIGNLKDEYVINFAKTLKVKPSLILPAVNSQNWELFVDLLITHIPRQGDHNRYDT